MQASATDICYEVCLLFKREIPKNNQEPGFYFHFH